MGVHGNGEEPLKGEGVCGPGQKSLSKWDVVRFPCIRGSDQGLKKVKTISQIRTNLSLKGN